MLFTVQSQDTSLLEKRSISLRGANKKSKLSFTKQGLNSSIKWEISLVSSLRMKTEWLTCPRLESCLETTAGTKKVWQILNGSLKAMQLLSQNKLVQALHLTTK